MIPILDDQIPSAALHLWRLMAKYTGTSIQADVESGEACTKREAAAWAEEKTPHLLDDSHPFCIVLDSGYFYSLLLFFKYVSQRFSISLCATEDTNIKGPRTAGPPAHQASSSSERR